MATGLMLRLGSLILQIILMKDYFLKTFQSWICLFEVYTFEKKIWYPKFIYPSRAFTAFWISSAIVEVTKLIVICISMDLRHRGARRGWETSTGSMSPHMGETILCQIHICATEPAYIYMIHIWYGADKYCTDCVVLLQYRLVKSVHISFHTYMQNKAWYMILCRKKRIYHCSQIYIWCPQGSTANPGAPAYPSPGKAAQRASGWVGSNGAWEPPGNLWWWF